MGNYIKNGEKCDYCGEDAKRVRDKDVPEAWADGTKLLPLKNKSRGVICADCRWWEFDELCQSQGCSAANPYLHLP